MISKSDQLRFWSKVKIKTKRECWEWQAYSHRQGYGFFKIGGLNRLAHRIAYQIKHKIALSPDQKVRHKCDNPACCNPAHLVLGTQQQNCMDAVKRKRHVGTRKIDEKTVMAILKDPRNNTECESVYGIHNSQICKIRKGRSWPSVFKQFKKEQRQAA